jgi:hypothetical protein
MPSRQRRTFGFAFAFLLARRLLCVSSSRLKVRVLYRRPRGGMTHPAFDSQLVHEVQKTRPASVPIRRVLVEVTSPQPL